MFIGLNHDDLTGRWFNYDHYYSDMYVRVSSITCCTEVTVLTTGPRSWTWRAGSGLGVTWLHPLPPSPSRPQHLTVSTAYNPVTLEALRPLSGLLYSFVNNPCLKVKLSQLFLFPWCFQWKIYLNWTSSDKHHLLACSPTEATEQISVGPDITSHGLLFTQSEGRKGTSL